MPENHRFAGLFFSLKKDAHTCKREGGGKKFCEFNCFSLHTDENDDDEEEDDFFIFLSTFFLREIGASQKYTHLAFFFSSSL